MTRKQKELLPPQPWKAVGRIVYDNADNEDAACGTHYSRSHTAAAHLVAAAPALLEAVEACLLRDDICDGELGDQLREALEWARIGRKPDKKTKHAN